MSDRAAIPAASLLVAILLIGACGGPAPTTQPAEEPSVSAPRERPPPREARNEFVEPGAMPGRTHIVQAKETLFGLAQRYYGNKNQWRRIYYANRNRVTDPNDIPVGIRLIIP